jgi:hypothetical protein
MLADIPSNWALNFTETASEYLLSLFKEEIGLDRDDRSTRGDASYLPEVENPTDLTADFAGECEHAAKVLKTAFQNRGPLLIYNPLVQHD